MRNSSKKKLHIWVGVYSLLILLGGLVATMSLTQQSQDNRIKAQTVSNPSGLPWSSGVVTLDPPQFKFYRTRDIDNTAVWLDGATWEAIKNPDINGAISGVAGTPKISMGVAMLPQQQLGTSFQICASGAYDAYYQQLGTNLNALNRGSDIVKLGWEANDNQKNWFMEKDLPNYKLCFKRQVQALKSTAPNIKIEWNLNKNGNTTQSLANAYPGDDVVDIIGINFYSESPAYPSQSAWDADYNSTLAGGPKGLGSWLAFAKQHNKKLAVSEWGISNGVGGGGDDVYYIEAMYNFFKNNAASLAYETYYNQEDRHTIHPTSRSLNASAKYKLLWSQAVAGGGGGGAATPTTGTNPTFPQPTAVTPTLFCLGGVPCFSPAPTNGMTTPPVGGINPTTNPSTTGTVDPNTTPSPTVSPCETQSSVQHYKHKKHKKHRHGGGNGGGFLSKFFEFLMKFLELIFKALGIPYPGTTNPDPNNPNNPNPVDPCPSPTTEQPVVEPTTEQPTIDPNVSPSTGASPVPSLTTTLPPSGAGGSPTTATCGGSANTPSSPVTGYTIAQCEDFNGSDTGAFDGYDGGGGDTVVGGGRKKAQCTGGGGMLTLTQTADGSTCGGSMGSFGQKYGYWEVKMRTMSTGSGGSAPHPVLILWPDTDWNDGELDFFETDLGEDGMSVFLHCVGNPSQNCYNTSYKLDYTQWHVYGFEWTAAGFKGFVDGKEIYSTDGKGSNPSVNMHQTIQLDNLSGKTPVSPGKMEIDWVHMYKK